MNLVVDHHFPCYLAISLGLQLDKVEEMLETFHSQTAGSVREALEAGL